MFNSNAAKCSAVIVSADQLGDDLADRIVLTRETALIAALIAWL